MLLSLRGGREGAYAIRDPRRRVMCTLHVHVPKCRGRSAGVRCTWFSIKPSGSFTRWQFCQRDAVKGAYPPIILVNRQNNALRLDRRSCTSVAVARSSPMHAVVLLPELRARCRHAGVSHPARPSAGSGCRGCCAVLRQAQDDTVVARPSAVLRQAQDDTVRSAVLLRVLRQAQDDTGSLSFDRLRMTSLWAAPMGRRGWLGSRGRRRRFRGGRG